MATLDTPSPSEVVRRVDEPQVSYGFENNSSDVLSKAVELIESALALAETAADGAAAPYDFPLAKELIAQRNPGFTTAQIEERFERQTAPFRRFMVDRAAADLVLDLKPENTRLDQQAIEWKRAELLQNAADALKSGKEFVAKLLKGSQAVPDGMQQLADHESSSAQNVYVF